MLINYKDKAPKIDDSCFIAYNSTIVGDVTIDSDTSIWFGTVIRGDYGKISIGRGTNIQDNCTLHVNSEDGPISIGNYVTVGHNAVIHGSIIEDEVLIGMGSIIMDNAHIGTHTLIGAGSLVPPGKTIPSGVLCLGSPAKVVRPLTEEEIKGLKDFAVHYIGNSHEFMHK